MVATVDYHDLLSVLKSMYFHIARLHLDQRLNIHKLKPANDSVDLSDTLYQQIDRLTSNRNDTATSTHRVGATADGSRGTPISSRRGRNSDEAKQHNGLRDHLQNLRQQTHNESFIGTRLEKATWNHMHHALCHARKGHDEKARLHAKIALQAMKEAHRYLDDERYQSFSKELRELIIN